MIITQTPFRLSFFGGGTDFPDFFREHGGATLSATINRYCYISVHELSPFFKHKFRASYAKTERVLSPSEFEHPLIRECLTFLNIEDGMEISHVADLPGQTGLGSSSAFTVGLLNALHAFRGEGSSAEQLAREAITVERERVGDIGGRQDQYAAAHGGILRVDYSNENDVEVRRLSLSSSRLRDFQQCLMLFYTGLDKSAQDILIEQKKRASKNQQVLSEMMKLVNEAEMILCEGNLPEFGKLLHETWEHKKTLSHSISNSTIDQAYDAARKAGALGGKLLGAGGRGFLLLFAEPSEHEKIREGLKGLKEVSFGISKTGSQVIFRTQEG